MTNVTIIYRVSLAIVAVIITACGPSGLGPWQEEVRLSDGRVIVVERYEESDVRKPIGDVGAAFLTRTTLKVVAPDALATLPVLTIDYRPLILDFDQKRAGWYVIAFDERACMRWSPEAIRKGIVDDTGRINLRPNAEYRLLDGKWVAVPMGVDRIGLPVNLLIRRITVKEWMDTGHPLPIEEKSRLDLDGGLPKKYHQIVDHVSCG